MDNPSAYVKEFHARNAWGLLSTVDLKECNPDTIRNADRIRDFVVQLCDLIGMKRFGECTVVNFGEDERVAGYSMTQLIETSLISGHFANINNSAYIDIFSCKAYEPADVENFAREFFEAKQSRIQVLLRY